MVNSVCRYLVPVLFVVSICGAFVAFCGILRQYCGGCCSSRTLEHQASICNVGVINTQTPKSDRHLISPNSINPESNIKDTRIKKMITN